MQSYTFRGIHRNIPYHIHTQYRKELEGFSAGYSFAGPVDKNGLMPDIIRELVDSKGDLKIFDNKDVAERAAQRAAYKLIDDVYNN
ncbi:hypothetical protein [Enterovibrio nigricans]|uniref:Uncharacterized protein n=1 Tax=Enterovibrio nigricans DSM 22720 TaxID=1121868 RepID=A0A1T4WHM0_9GAMM|nr:hypothetical protein [Enterovibrio nigricans]PKF48644.1 hypothetical protein AT251_24575 [Enterovibrio nigricans]SKA76814.1 hypothetical protein SAMN02745132_04942 [Enterovibrio nigricans DSM 22720]